MEIRLARHGRHIAIVSIDNGPRLNAMTRQMLSKLGALWDELERDPTCRCIILTGAGERAFTVGADISGDLSAGLETARMVNHALLKHDAHSKPIVAAVNGDCIGGGLELLLSTDIRAAVPEARFGLPEVKWSIYPFGGSTIKLIQQIGYVHAMDLLLTARLIDAEQAMRLGLVNRLVPRDELLDYAALKTRADAFAQSLLAVGVQHGDRVALLATNRPEWIICTLAAAKIGAIIAAISTFSAPRELAWALEHCGAVAMITLEAFRGR